jgi:hypothetical protein
MKKRKCAINRLLRFILYTAIVFILAASLPTAITKGGISVFREGGAVESFQITILLISVVLFICHARFYKANPLFYIIAALETITGRENGERDEHDSTC